MIVIDASVLAPALLDDTQGTRVQDRLGRDSRWVAPDHIRLEVASVARGRSLAKKVTEERAEQALRALDSLGITTVGLRQLWPTVWRLRNTMTVYDAAYVAAACLYNCALMTADLRLARAAVSYCAVDPVHLDGS